MKAKSRPRHVLHSNDLRMSFIRRVRWEKGVFCPHCYSRKIDRAGKNGRSMQRYVCRKCGKYFTDLTGTVFHRSRLSLREWFYLITESQSRPLYAIAADLKKPYWTVWRNARRFKKDMFVKRMIFMLRGAID